MSGGAKVLGGGRAASGPALASGAGAAPWSQGRGALAPGPEPAPLAPAGPCRARPALLAALLTLGAALLALEAALCALEAVLLLQLEAAPAAAAAVGSCRLSSRVAG